MKFNRNKIKSILFGIVLLFVYSTCNAQSYEVELTPLDLSELGGLQSYAIGTYKGEWLLVGGRLDGLHQRQPFAAFDADGRNQQLIVVNPQAGKVWRSSLSSLPVALAAQLSSTNMQFYQANDNLVCIGGYGYSSMVDDHITFPYLTIIDLPATIFDIKNSALNTSTFHQAEDEFFRVTGGALNRIDDIYYLVGGHKFMGLYNPMGPEQGPGFEQEYTDEIRRFKIQKKDTFEIELLDPIHDVRHLHRRDYNLVPTLSSGKKELMMYSGVFQFKADIPWLYPVNINRDGLEPLDDFTQYFNHYHCAHLPIYDKKKDDMHTIFFGGIAQFYKEGQLLVQDNDVPFVNTITDVQRDKFGNLSEARLDAVMPGYLGAGSVFIFNQHAPMTADYILDGTKITNQFSEVGYVYGGIRSSRPHIFWTNTGQESEANRTLYKVAIRKAKKKKSSGTLAKTEYLQFYPNPPKKSILMIIDLAKPDNLSIVVSDMKGNIIHSQKINHTELKSGRNTLTMKDVDIGYGAFNYSVTMDNKVINRKVIWSE